MARQLPDPGGRAIFQLPLNLRVMTHRKLHFATLLLAAMTLFLTPLPAFSQSCALCYTQASSAGARMIQALRSGIIVLVAPPMLMTLAVFGVAYRKRNQFYDENATAESDPIV